MVDFDIRPFLHPEAAADARNTKYDLTAIIVSRELIFQNHYGYLSAGHYTAYIRSEDRWYCYDDSRTYEVKTNDIAVGNAYMLFYTRKSVPRSIRCRDVKTKGVAEILRGADSPFVGMPVTVKYGGQGYIKAIRASLLCRYVVRFTDSAAIGYFQYCDP